MPKISLIFINYNNEKYLNDALESVRGQSFRDWECIIVDDGSTDNSKKIINSFCNSDKRFLFIEKENGGCGSARNTGLAVASGEYIMFMDSDDIMAEYAMDNLMAARYQYSADITYGTCAYIPDNYKHKKIIQKRPDIRFTKQLFFGGKSDYDKLLDIDRKKFNFCWSWLCLFPRELLNGILWDVKIYRDSDSAFMIDVLANADSVVVVDMLVSLHRDSSASLSRSGFNAKLVSYVPELLKHVYNPLHFKIKGKFEKRFYKYTLMLLFIRNIIEPFNKKSLINESVSAIKEIYGKPELPLKYLSFYKRIMLWFFIRGFYKK